MSSREIFFGLDDFDQHETKDPDEIIYSLNKFVKLALNCNPNIIELLFIDNQDLILIEDINFKYFRKKYREAFLSKRIFTSYFGYASSQIHKIKTLGNCLPDPSSRRGKDIMKNGYDTKAASHIIRLLVQAEQLILEKRISFPIKSDQLTICKNIREGLLTYYDVKKIIEETINRVRVLKDECSFPDFPDRSVINKAFINLNTRWYIRSDIYNSMIF